MPRHDGELKVSRRVSRRDSASFAKSFARVNNDRRGKANFQIDAWLTHIWFCSVADIAWLRLLLACFGIVGMSVSFTTVYLFSGELFPTVVRNIGVGTSSMCARLGSIVAPFVVSLVSSRVLIDCRLHNRKFRDQVM